MFSFIEATLEADVDARRCAALHRAAKWWKEKAGEPRRAPALPTAKIERLQEDVLSDAASGPDRFVAARARIQVGVSSAVLKWFGRRTALSGVFEGKPPKPIPTHDSGFAAVSASKGVESVG